MIKMGLIQPSCDPSTFQVLKEDYFRSVLKLRNNAWNIGTELKTDGIASCVNVVRGNANDVYYSKPKRKKKGASVENIHPQSSRDDVNYFANDQGNVNLASVIQVCDGEIVSQVTFKKSQYKHESHINFILLHSMRICSRYYIRTINYGIITVTKSDKKCHLTRI